MASPSPRQKSTTSSTSSRLPPEVASLDLFAGEWHAEGDVYSPEGQARWSSEEHYEWLAGNRFMTYRWDARVGGHAFQGLGVLGQDEFGLFAQFYDNAGHAPRYRVSVNGSRWKFSGEAQRATYEFASDGSSLKIHWDVKGPDGSWTPLCDLVARRSRDVH